MTPSCHIRKVVYPRIYLFGDSLTQRSHSEDGCWGSLVAEGFERRCDIVVRGFSGYNTRMCKYVLPRIFGPEDAGGVAAFVIFLGANDCSEPSSDPGTQNVPLKEFISNLEEMLRYLKVCGVPMNKIILLTPPPYCDEKWVAWCKETGRDLPRRNLEIVSKYADAVSKLGNELHVAVINIFAAFQQEQNWKTLLIDGLHLSKPGSQKLARCLMPFLEQAVGPVPAMFPDWKCTDPADPESSIASWAPDP
uniref:Putative isoamyl acetate-hydrolyzing esterase n=1 Tax=Hyalomma excavatum TaxID=257692 RepID=A0A131XIX6_9ACAR